MVGDAEKSNGEEKMKKLKKKGGREAPLSRFAGLIKKRSHPVLYLAYFMGKCENMLWYVSWWSLFLVKIIL